MNRYVLGIDSALQRTGVAFIELVGGHCRARTHVIATTPTTDTVTASYRRIVRVVRGVATVLPRCAELALIEAPALDADYGDSWSRAAVWYGIIGIIGVLEERDIPIAKVAPTTLKKWATGRGGSKQRPVEKADVVRAMHAMWPGVPATSSDLRHHECEALGMAHMCAQHLGWPVPVRAHHGEPLAVVKWPAPAQVGATS